MTYAEKLRSPKWQKKRLEILQRDDFTCQLCNDKESTLHVHHKEYINGNQPWEYEDENFITYCSACHSIVEANKNSVEFISAKKTVAFENGASNIYLSYIDNDGDVCIAVYYFNPFNGDLESIVAIGTSALSIINNLHQGVKIPK